MDYFERDMDLKMPRAGMIVCCVLATLIVLPWVAIIYLLYLLYP